jgi:hypothetical protein
MKGEGRLPPPNNPMQLACGRSLARRLRACATFVRRRHGSCRSLLPMPLLGAATAAPRRFVARGSRAQLIGPSVRPRFHRARQSASAQRIIS